ncbi:uncharacterized protein LOC118769846 isoform X1 [Megalops cyprinoides]|uniref:uncharacterized protein LOC118769846 isoform X1 n=1 Tax=Megalops cyprinoides TaxID=118141 RepID=UPI0018653D34|nr:uncharacterized protein LOC118769846 isoform X1 [Megalops cyprinoides]
MSESVYTYVNDTLDKLSADEFNRFKRKLSELKKIGYGLIEKAATVDLTWEIVNRFTEEGAVECVVDVLNAIDLKKFAKELEKEAHTCQTDSRTTEAEGAGAKDFRKDRGETSGRKCTTAGVEFVDDNKAELIQRIKLVEPLAEALGAMIPDEAYSKIRAARTSQEKMRELYSALEEGGPVVKAAFYRALCKQNKYLVEHLGGH